MSKRTRIIASCLLVFCAGLSVWYFVVPHEPGYQGRSLTEWLEEYNRAGSIENIGPVDEAVRAMGPKILPYLRVNILPEQPEESPLFRKVREILNKSGIVNLPKARLDPRYQMPSILALAALGTVARPLVPELWPGVIEVQKKMEKFGTVMFEDGLPGSSLALCYMRTNSASALAQMYPDMNGEWEKDLAMNVIEWADDPRLPIKISWEISREGSLGVIVEDVMIWTGQNNYRFLTRSVVALHDHQDPAVRFVILDTLERAINRAGISLANVHEKGGEPLMQALVKASESEDSRESEAAQRLLEKLSLGSSASLPGGAD